MTAAKKTSHTCRHAMIKASQPKLQRVVQLTKVVAESSELAPPQLRETGV